MRADDAHTILNNEGFKSAVEALKSRYLEQLMTVPVGDLTVPHIHAKLRALEDVRSELQSAITDFDMEIRRSNNRK